MVSKIALPLQELSVPNVTTTSGCCSPCNCQPRSIKKGSLSILKILLDCNWNFCYPELEPAMRQYDGRATKGD